MPEPQQTVIFEAAALAGEILLASGAEVFRVDDTMRRIAAAYHCEGFEPFVIGNGIFVSASDALEHRAKVRHIPLSGTRLDKIDAVNQLSREIEQGKHTPEQALRALQAIQTLPETSRTLRIVCSGLGAGAFCFFYGGTLGDCAASFLAGVCLYAYFLLLVKGRLSKIAANISGAMLASFVGIGLVQLGLGSNASIVMVGSIIPLLPGVAFTNAIRDFAHEDYISGSVRVLDVLLCVVCTAFGVSLVLLLFGKFGGIVL